MRVNVGKVINGGMVAGCVMNLIDFLINYLTQTQWRAEMTNLNPAIVANAESWFAIASWVVLDFVMGIVLTATYAAILPRFGPGPGTATRAALLLWMFAACIWASFYVVGMFSLPFLLLNATLALVNMIAGASVGAALYKDA